MRDDEAHLTSDAISPGFTMPRSVMMAVMSLAGVTSKAGLRALAPFGAMRTLSSFPRDESPQQQSTSSSERSSMGMLAPEAHSLSIVLVGAAT